MLIYFACDKLNLPTGRAVYLIHVPLRSSTQDTPCENCYIAKGGVSPLADSYMNNKYDDIGEDYFYMVTFKLNATFPEAQFLLDGFSKPYRLDRCENGSGIVIFVREDIPSRFIVPSLTCGTESFFIEINLRNRRRLLSGIYIPHKILAA